MIEPWGWMACRSIQGIQSIEREKMRGWGASENFA